MKIHNTTPGLSRPLMEKQVREFLANSKLNLQLGAIDEKGEPNIHFIWYLFENERLYIMTPKKSKKARNALLQKMVICLSKIRKV